MKLLDRNSIITVCCVISLFSYCTKEIDEVALVEKGGIKYELNSSKGFTGLAIRAYENGQRKYECQYQDGKRDGYLRRWHKNGQLSAEYYYSNNALSGTFLEWFSSGEPEVIANYENNQLHGDYSSWYSPSQLSKKCTYSNGKLVGKLTSWWGGSLGTGQGRGQSKVIANYDGDGYRDGEYISYYSNGQLQENSFYKNGILHGPYVHWTDLLEVFSQKYLYAEGEFDMGKKIGNWKYLDPNGRSISVEEYIALGGSSYLFADLRKIRDD